MYTAKVTNKETINGQLNVTVEFTNGTDVVTETVIPQDRDGFFHWLKSRLATFNGGVDLDAELSIDQAVEAPTQPTPATPTQEEIDRADWFDNYNRLKKVEELVSLGVVATDHAKVVALRDLVKTTIKPEYIDMM